MAATETSIQWKPRAQIRAWRQVIVEDCLMRLAAVVSPQPPPRWSHTQEDGHNYEMVYAPEVSSTCRVKSESGDWVTENWGMGTRALSAGRVRRAQAGLGRKELWGNKKILWGRCKL